MGEMAPQSPCINVCAVDAAGVCNGCLRTLGEIASWTTLSAAEQWAVIGRIAQRERARSARSPPAAVRGAL